jgi:hypothetical protein
LEKWIIHITKTLRDELIWLFTISIGVFLFILFFQPFPLEFLEFNDRLLFVIGFGLITFLIAIILFILFPLVLPGVRKTLEWIDGPPVITSFLFILINSTAFSFYIRYVGKAELSFYLVFKVALVCFLALLTLILLFKFRSYHREIASLQESNNFYLSRIHEIEHIGEKEEIEIFTDSRSENLKLKYASILFIRSADNYIEIFYQENGQIVKKLIRSTLKNIETQLAIKKQFIRCHRTCIVNTMHIEKLQRNYSGYYLKLNFYEDAIPVSRQYLMQVKSSLS